MIGIFGTFLNLNQIWVLKSTRYKYTDNGPWLPHHTEEHQQQQLRGSLSKGLASGIPPSPVPHLASLWNALEACPTVRYVEIIPGGHILRSQKLWENRVTALPELALSWCPPCPYQVGDDLLMR